MKILNKANDEDLIILSDVDEIPNLNKLNLFNKKILAYSHKECLCIKLIF